MWLPRDGVEYVLHARRKYYKRSRYDFVHVRGSDDDDADPWFARVLAIIKVRVEAQHPHIAAAGFLPLAIVQWLKRQPVDFVPGIPTFEYWPAPAAIEIAAIERPVKLLDCPVPGADGKERVCALRYGKSGMSNGLFM